MVEVLILGALAGAITTVAGMGGGLLLTLGLSLVHGPLTALAITGPGLLVGNVHRAWLYREHVHRPTAWRFVAGAVPGALIGGLIATGIPQSILQALLVALAVLASAKVLFRWRWQPPAAAITPAAALAGFVTATSGGGGLIAGPTLLSTGLTSREYVGTGAFGAAFVHLARITGYSAGGRFDAHILFLGLVAAAAILLGNLLGERLRTWIPPVAVPRLEIGVVLVALGMALSGL